MSKIHLHLSSFESLDKLLRVGSAASPNSNGFCKLAISCIKFTFLCWINNMLRKSWWC